MSEIKYIITDLDDTLVDDTANHRGAFEYVLKELGIPYQEKLFQEWLEFDSYYWHEYFKTLKVPEEFIVSGEAQAEWQRGMRFQTFFKRELEPIKMQEIFKEGLKKNIIALPGVVEALKEISTYYPIYVSTNGDSIIAHEKIERIGATDYISSIFSADMTNPPSNKSELDFYRQLMKRIGAEYPSECLMIGDKYRDDVIMPNKAGLKTCWINKEKKDGLICDYQLASFAELPKILKRTNFH
ncbi:MAG: HAD family hydrolase [Bacilli bacterium]|nr:HAD family hydrolase [Bacilli bacterium]